MEGTKALIALAVLFKRYTPGLDQGHQVNALLEFFYLLLFYHLSFSL